MWKIKTFKTKDAMQKFIDRHFIVWHEVFIDNTPYAIEYAKVTKVIDIL